MVEVLKKDMLMSFDEAAEHVNKTVQEEGFSVLLVKSIDEIFKKKLGIIDQPKYTTILACGSELTKMSLEAHYNVGLLFPCSFVVYEEGDKVIDSHTSLMKIARDVGLASAEAMVPVVEKIGKLVEMIWKKL